MTNPVNAGADIEKAESLVLDELNVSWERQNGALTVFVYEPKFKIETLSPASPEYTAHFAMDKAWAYLVKLRAALLAEAGERAKLEAELFDRVLKFLAEEGFGGMESWSDPIACLMSIVRCLKSEAEQARYDAGENLAHAEAAELNASAEAERARGLEAQLETVTCLLRRFRDKLKIILPIVDSMVTLQFARTGTRYIGPNLAEEMNEADAALSQLPTPQEP